jgi:hypothetical protein
MVVPRWMILRVGARFVVPIRAPALAAALLAAVEAGAW